MFIDTNAFLNFFAFSPDDVEELKKLKAFIASGDLVLHLPQQVIAEFVRNREKKIETALDEFSKSSLRPVPLMLRGFAAAAAYNAAKDDFNKAQNELLKAARAEAKAKKLPADEIFEELKSKAKIVKRSDDIYKKALVRKNLGDPPGKDDSLGDRVGLGEPPEQCSGERRSPHSVDGR